MPLRTLIVDDEPIARKVLREELDSLEDVEIVGEADSGTVALERISEDHPDLVLLDLQMPMMGGLEVVRNLRRGKHLPVIVIVTAYDQYALQAFEAGAIDYLLKPVGGQRLAEAVERARRLTQREAVERLAQLQEISGPDASSERSAKNTSFSGPTRFTHSRPRLRSCGSSPQRRSIWPPRPSRCWKNASGTPAFEEFIGMLW
jgi:YesN/AraC family two-component response regulator